MTNQKAGNDAMGERRYEARHLNPDRRSQDADIIEHVIRGVRREYARATSHDRPLRRDRSKRD